MTQMVGRALRGPAAGGDASAYIVSFIDEWNEHIAWVNPESLFVGDNDFEDSRTERVQHILRLVSISKIEEFASILDDSVDTTLLERVPFEERIPVGMYAFSYRRRTAWITTSGDGLQQYPGGLPTADGVSSGSV